MTSLSALELARLRAASQATMRDRCVLGTQAAPTGFEPSGGAWTYSATEIVCGVGAGASSEVQDGTQTTVTDATIRLPHGTNVTGVSRIRVTHRPDELDTPEDYAVVGAPKMATSQIVCLCKRITGESAL